MTTTMVKVARLDHDRVYWGLEARAARDVKPGELVFCPRAVWAQIAAQVPAGARWAEEDCDLPAGAYVWTPQPGRFEPLPLERRKTEAQAPSLEQAFYDLIQNGASGARVHAWLDWYEKTMDERGAKK